MKGTDNRDEFSTISLVQGGPFYRVGTRLGLCDPDLRPAYKRMLVAGAITWLPLLVLSLIEGHARTGSAELPFFRDITAHVRFLIAVPAFLAASTAVHSLIGMLLENFITRGIIREADVPRFRAAVASLHKVRDSSAIEIGILAVAYTIGILIWRTRFASEMSSWYASPSGSGMDLTLAGYWLVFCSLPIFYFLLLRWYVRLANWFVFLFRVSRLDLNLIPTHSDRSGGIGFVGRCTYGFSAFLFGEGALLAGFVANSALYEGKSVMEFKTEAMVGVGICVAFILAPMLVFAFPLIRTKWGAIASYGGLTTRYVRAFDERWIDGVNPDSEPLLGTGDIQSLADLTNSMSVVRDMRCIPFVWQDVVWLLAMTMLPLVPLILLVSSVEQIFGKLVKIVF